MLERAHVFAKEHHGAQKRASGEPYISHPLAVAHMLADLKLDVPSVVTGLLHDTVEDTPATLADIKKEFGDEVSYLVDGITKLSRIELQSSNHTQAENLRKFVLAMAQDMRVLLVKLMDRLHNMRTLHYLPSEDSRKRISLETLEIYSPLAERIGMFSVQEQLQNLSFANLNPDAHQAIMKRIAEFHEKGQDIVKQVIANLESIFEKGGIKASIYGREKKPYSVWRKMQKKNINFDQLADLFGFRILVHSVADCYQALGLIHNAYLVKPQKFKDYISTPKPNHYQSMHTTVIGPHGVLLEIQIRTHHMQEIAERGVAAHWEYKQAVPSKDLKNYRWLRSLLDILDQASGAEEFLEHTKLEMFQDQVFCFTPKGDVINLPSGATVIDFAYALHSEVGNHCKSARVNGRVVPLRTELRNGDQVEVLTDQTVQPLPDWEKFVVTGKAQANIRRFMRSQKRSQFIKLGQSIYQNKFSEVHRNAISEHQEKILKHFALQTMDDLYSSLGNGGITPDRVKEFMFPESVIKISKDKKGSALDGDLPVEVKGLFPGVAIHYAGCCHPLPGDKITGIIVAGKGVTIHRAGCELLQKYEDDPKKWIEVSWGKTAGSDFQGRLSMMVHNAVGTLGTIATMMGKHEANIVNLRVVKRHKDHFEILFDLMVRDLKHLEQLVGLLRTLPSVQSVERG